MTFTRDSLERSLLDQIETSPLLISGPPGSGKSFLLRRLIDRLERTGWIAVALDLFGAASSPERFVRNALDALPASHFAGVVIEATRIQRLSSEGRVHAADAVAELFSLWSTLDTADGRPVALVLDEPTEIRSLAYFRGLREVHRLFGEALSVRRRGTILATSYPALARRLWPQWSAYPLPPLRATEVSASWPTLGPEAVDWIVAASFGWPAYARVLCEAVSAGADPHAAWIKEMEEGGRLERLCRHTYETLLLRSRGYGISKAVLAAVAHEEGLNLTALVERLGRTPGAVRDYLVWLVGVDALCVQQRRYFYVDGLLRRWVRLHARGVAPNRDELREAAQEITTGQPEVVTPEIPATDAPPPRRRPESLMEID